MRVLAGLLVLLICLGAADARSQTPLPDDLRAFRPPWPGDATPVRLMHVPDEHRLLGGWMGTGDSVTALLRLPAMARWDSPDPCPRLWCDGKLLVTVTTGDRPALYDAVWSLRKSIFRAGAAPSPTETYTRSAPPPDYNEAWQQKQLVASPLLPAEGSIFLRSTPDGVPVELARCAGAAPDAIRCDVETILPDAPAIHIQYTFGQQHWPDREVIRRLITGTVRSWL